MWEEFVFTTTYQAVTGIIAVCGFVLSLVQFISRRREKRRNINFCIVEIRQSGRIFLLNYLSENRSSDSVSITSVQIIVGGKTYDMIYDPTVLLDEPNFSHNVIYREQSDKIPILLNPLITHGGYMAFDIPYEISKNIENPTLIIATTNGKPIKYTFCLNKTISIRRKAKPTRKCSFTPYS